MKLRLSCQEVSRLLSAQQEQAMPAPERARLRLHLVMCEACRNVDDQMAFIRSAMKRLADGHDAPPGADDRSD
jgi:predicted anti-sigma-YlaC factor YlaD